ncbi:uncharacterized protein UDID_07866 [Ustilago sp. UG-2017a]|nr:uncharacterized protein UDID_07866 [Ustilago sp. UG-2017a]
MLYSTYRPPVAPPSFGSSKPCFTHPADEELPCSSPPKKAVRDSKRRATHSQIERRRREKIDDCLVTLRSIVPACAKELEDRRRQKQEEQDEAARIAAGGAPKTYIDAATGKPKRKRNRKRPDTKKNAPGGEELGLHKLDVLTHAINYIFELKAEIHELKTEETLEWVATADNPWGVRNKDGSFRQDAKVEDQVGHAVPLSTLSHTARGRSGKKAEQGDDDDDDDDDDDEDEEEDQIEDDPVEGDDEDQDGDKEKDEPLERRSKKRLASSITTTTTTTTATSTFPPPAPPTHIRRTDTTYSSSSSHESAQVSPAFSLIHASPSTTISPATTIASPLMSLSAESPILLPDPAISIPAKRTSRVSQSPAFSALPCSAIPLPANAAGRRESSTFLFKQLSLTSPSFPPTSATTASGEVRGRSTTLSFPSYGEQSELRQTGEINPTPGLSDATDSPTTAAAAAAAALLLNFSTSPEVLRPVGSTCRKTGISGASVASSPHTRPVIGLPGRSRSSFSSPQYRPYPSSTSSSVGSQPRGVGASVSLVQKAESAANQEPEPLHLASPPHLALDGTPEKDNKEQPEEHVMSDNTVDHLPALAALAVAMNTAT